MNHTGELPYQKKVKTGKLNEKWEINMDIQICKLVQDLWSALSSHGAI